jgi:hypothetical protein
MKRIFWALVGGGVLALTVVSFSMDAKSAEIGVPPARVARALPPCVGTGPCNPACLHHDCKPLCPDGYSCYPLYGAYGPYGGTAYWDAYTGGGWGYRRW